MPESSSSFRSVRVTLALTLILCLAAALRGLFPTADPPWRATSGIVWHDEGAWTHNARNRALFGTWRTDEWNPIFVAPVFTALEYASFATFGVGTWQARLVSQAASALSVLLLALGLCRLAGSAAGLAGGLLLATNYVYVMYGRAALMESTMTLFVVASWWAVVQADANADPANGHGQTSGHQGRAEAWRIAAWAITAGLTAWLAYFTKAAAAFIVAALIGAALWSLSSDARGASATSFLADLWQRLARLLRPRTYRLTRRGDTPLEREQYAAAWILAGLAAGAVIAIVLFVGPWWSEYRFYNWQMSVTRKPSYSARALMDRLSWLPVLHDLFTRMWIAWLIGLCAMLGALWRWRTLRLAERVLFLWIAIGIAELLVHDVGNERRFVFLIPALIAMTALTLFRDRRLLPADIVRLPRAHAWLWLPLIAYACYLGIAALARVPFLYDVAPSVRTSAALAAMASLVLIWTWPRVPGWLSAAPWPARAAIVLTLVAAAGDLVQVGQWAAGRTYKNVEASRALGRMLPPGTLVHGKLANGLALENGIRPIFVGRQFGNYADRTTRADVAYVLTYVRPRIGYEGSVILDVLEAYPQHRILCRFDVAESRGGDDRVALMAKGPPAAPAVVHGACPTTR